MKMFYAQWKAETLRIIRSPFFMIFSIVMPITFYFLFASLNGPELKIGGTTWGVYSLMSMTAFSLIGTAVSQFGIRLAYERKEGWIRQLQLTPLPMATWLSAKLASQLLIHLCIILLLFPVAAFVYGLELSFSKWFLCGLWLLAGSVPFLAIGALVGTMKNADAATAISNVLLMGMAVAGGLWMPLETLPGWLQKAAEWLPSYHYAKGAWDTLAGQTISMENIAFLISCTVFFMVLSSYILKKREAI
ncbi:ABC transporter [Bacillus sp. M6-12]|uniref:ABC transporter permease n=1 Tax=Bacillus sp. M6-12 TaxID=2054166 RepID=UPI000C75925F|nr:ABC transporter permease [Bacillus sp. M6-12]PLS16173.1 ABC transporter [Bacillus sp. M6-12]